jgi:hypothetical protein
MMPNLMIMPVVPVEESALGGGTAYHWMYNDGSGTTVAEEFHGKNLTTNCSWVTTGKNGTKAGDFNGTNDYSYLSDSAMNVGRDSFSWAAWIYPNDTQPIHLHDKGDYYPVLHGYHVYYTASGDPGSQVLVYADGVTSDLLNGSVTIGLNTGEWTHVAGSFNYSDGVMKAYKNGNYVGQVDLGNPGGLPNGPDTTYVYYQCRQDYSPEKYSYTRLQDVWLIKGYVITASEALWLYKYLG